MKKEFLYLFIFIVLSAAVAIGCANRGMGPQGGPKDTKPPVPLKSKPENGAVNYKKNNIEVIFDEIILIEKAYENVVVSPPQIKPPVVKALGRKLVVNLADTLQENTTYTIDFGNAIVDNNEKNVLENYSFSFATGAQIDTLQMSGILISAENLNPLPNVIIGIHSDLSDSAFLTKPFDRITKTNSQGKFTIKNIKEGKYRIYALADVGNNYKFDIPDEKIAFLDTIFEPIAEVKYTHDTVWRDSIFDRDTMYIAFDKKRNDSVVVIDQITDTIKVIDSIKTTHETFYFPDSIILKAFTEEFHKQYMIKSERKDKYHFILYFNDIADSLPKINALNFPFDNAVFIQANERKDTITYWLTDSLAWNTDTLQVEISYLKTDSTNQLAPQTDTLYLKYRKPKESTRKPVQNQPKKQEFIKIATNATSTFDFFNNLEMNFVSPTVFNEKKKILIEQKRDTSWIKQNITFEKGDSIGLKYLIKGNWKAGETYRLSVDSAAFSELYGKVNDKFTTNFTCKPKDSYASLTLEIGYFTGKEIVQLLDKDDKVLKTQRVTSDKVKFEYLAAGTYYARLFVDENGNGKWDTGKFIENRQPESVYYYPYHFQLRELWDAEEYWDYLEFPLLEQKPKELIKEEKKN